MPAQTFEDSGNALPWGEWYPYSIQNIDVNDNNYFVTVIYSTPDASSEQDKYLKHWFNNHPGLLSLRSTTNFREVSITDPVYTSYLRNAIPNTPAILVTRPADNGYFGKTVYLAYGSHLSTDPNVIASELEAAMQQQLSYEQYQPQTIQQNLPPMKPMVASTAGLSDVFLFAVIAITVFLVLKKRGR